MVEAIVLAAETPGTEGETFLLGDEKATSIGEILDSIEAALDKKARRIRLPIRLVLAVLGSPGGGEFYYVSDGKTYSWEEIVEALAEALHRKPVLRLRTPALLALAAFSEGLARISGTTPILTKARVQSARRDYWTFDNARIRNEPGFEPQADFHAGIRAIAAAGPTGRESGGAPRAS